MSAFAMESAVLRARKMAAPGLAHAMTQVFAREAMETAESAARTVLAACSEGDALRMNLSILKRFAKCEAVNSIGLRREIAAALLEAGKYRV